VELLAAAPPFATCSAADMLNLIEKILYPNIFNAEDRKQL